MPGTQGTDAHAGGRGLDAQRDREAQHAEFRRGVADTPRRRQQSAHRRRVDDVAEALADHHRVGGLHAVGDAPQVDVEDRIPVLALVVLDLSADADARVVEQVVQAAVPRHRCVDQTSNRVRIDNVNTRGHRLAADRPQRRGNLLDAGLLPIGQHDGRIALDQRSSQRVADSRGGPVTMATAPW